MESDKLNLLKLVGKEGLRCTPEEGVGVREGNPKNVSDLRIQAHVKRGHVNGRRDWDSRLRGRGTSNSAAWCRVNLKFDRKQDRRWYELQRFWSREGTRDRQGGRDWT